MNTYPIATLADSKNADLAKEFVDLVDRRPRASPSSPTPGSPSRRRGALDRVRSGCPGWVFVPAAAGAIFVVLPLAAIVSRVEWDDFLGLITSESSQAALALSLRTSATSTLLCVLFGVPMAMVLARTTLPAASSCCARSCCCRWCCRRSWAASRCSTPSAAAACSANLRGARDPGRVLHHRGRAWRRPSWRCRSWWSASRARCAPRGSATRPSPRRSGLARRPCSGGSPCRWCCPAWPRERCCRSPARWASSARRSPSPAACRGSPGRCRWRSTCSARPTRTPPSRSRWCWSSSPSSSSGSPAGGRGA